MTVKDLNKAIENTVKEYKDSVLTYENVIKIFPKAPSGANIKKLLALVQLFNVSLISSQEQAKRMNEVEAKRKLDQINKLRDDEDNVFDLLKNKELLEWSRSDSPVRMYLREMGQIPLLTKEEEIEIINEKNFNQLDRIKGEKYLRNKKWTEFRSDDMQRFTLLRYAIPELMGYKGEALVIDPDIFLVKNKLDELMPMLKDNALICRALYKNERFIALSWRPVVAHPCATF